MSGKRITLILLLLGCFVMSACTIAASSLQTKTDEDPLAVPSPAGPEARSPDDLSQKSVKYTQKIEKLPGKKTLTSFPGVLESMSLTLEQIVTVFGTQFELQENKAQNYDTYLFSQYDLAFDFDKASKKISTIWLKNKPYYVHSGAFRAEDFNGDGAPEKIIAYEDQRHDGHILVMDDRASGYSEAPLGSFGDKCEIEVLPKFGPDQENLVLVKTLGENGGDVLQWDGGKLISILPQGYDKLPESSMVTIEGDKAVLVNEARDVLYVCPIPDRAVRNINGRTDDGVRRFSIHVIPEKSGDSILLKVRTSLQVLLLNNYMDSPDGIFCDVAQVTAEYKYLGRGKWQEQKTEGGPKYKVSAEAAVRPEDLSVDGIMLYDDYRAVNHPMMKELSTYAPTGQSEGVLLKRDGLGVGVTQGEITYLSLDGKSDKSTSKGLKLSDSREKAVSLYGLPDRGFMDDPVWTYYAAGGEKSEGDPAVSTNTLNIEFDNENVCRIWISAYVTAHWPLN